MKLPKLLICRLELIHQLLTSYWNVRICTSNLLPHKAENWHWNSKEQILFYRTEGQTLPEDVASCFASIFFNNSVLITFDYLSRTCVELIFVIPRITMTSAFTILAKIHQDVPNSYARSWISHKNITKPTLERYYDITSFSWHV